MRARVAVILAGVLLAGCGGRNPTDTDAESLPNRPLDAYARQGLITGQEDFPVVGGFATVAGPGDSTWLLFGASLPARALRFHRAEDGFAAGYSVRLRLSRDGVERARSDRGEQVRVATFEETGRTDESLVYQDYLLVEPGTYVVDVAIHDSIGTRALVRTDTIDVPLYRDGDAAIVLVHEAAFRSGDRTQPPRLILNSRRAIAYGDGEARVYVELYGTTADAELVVLDESGARVFAQPLRGQQRPPGDFSATVATLPVDSLPLGVLTVALRGADSTETRTSLLVTISDQWMVANYDEVLDYLTYVASRAEIDSLRAARTAAERRAAWESFWARRDPVPASPVNEYREEFFERVRVASEQFAETGRPGWRTPRGQVYIVLGAPDRVTTGEIDRRDLGAGVDAVEWIYERASGGRLQLLFIDSTGFGRFEMTRSSELAFRAAAERMRDDVTRGL